VHAQGRKLYFQRLGRVQISGHANSLNILGTVVQLSQNMRAQIWGKLYGG